jgi:hypothetical protein
MNRPCDFLREPKRRRIAGTLDVIGGKILVDILSRIRVGPLPPILPNVPFTAGTPRINHRVNTDPGAENIRERLRLMYYTE